MQVTVKWTNVCEKHHEKHPEPLEEVYEDVWDIATDKEDGVIMFRFEDSVLQLNRACILKLDVEV